MNTAHAPASLARSLAARNAWTLAALLPGLGLQLAREGMSLLATIALALVVALVFEAASLQLRRQPLVPFLREGSALSHALLLVSWMPGIPLAALVVALFAGLVPARQAFGGLARNLFQPAAVAIALAQLLAPAAMRPPEPDSTLAAAWLLGGFVLLALRIVRWHAPLCLLVGGALGPLLAGTGWNLASPLWALAAFFIASDPVTTPEGRWLRALAALLAGMAAGTAGASGPMLLPFALLCVNAATPALDAWRLPRRAPVAP